VGEVRRQRVHALQCKFRTEHPNSLLH
jgi:hypothetical protein